MKTYIPGDGSSYEGEMTPVDECVSFDCGQWVPADVAQGLYDALRDWLDAEDHPGAWMSCRDQAKRALAAADGEDE